MDKSEYQQGFMRLPLVEQKRLVNTVEFINKFHPHGPELHSILQGLSPAARQLLGDTLMDKMLDRLDVKITRPPES